MLFMGKFNLSEASFQEGLSTNEFFETTDESNRKVYAWSSNYFDVSETKRQGPLLRNIVFAFVLLQKVVFYLLKFVFTFAKFVLLET